MPPVTRNQLKKVGERHKPYSENNSKQNGPLGKRTALLDIPNNVSFYFLNYNLINLKASATMFIS